MKLAISRQLGFKRTGKNISARIERTIENLLRARKVVRLDTGPLKLNGDQGRNHA